MPALHRQPRALLIVALTVATLPSLASGSCPSTSSCGCAWAANGCGANDGSACWKTCCACSGGSSAPEAASSSGPGTFSGSWEGTAKTTRYYDCCKPSCSWPTNIPRAASAPVRTCGLNGRTIGANAINVCSGGGDSSDGASYTCTDQQPGALPDGTLTAFVAANSLCCACHELEFTNTALAGKRMVVQVTNAGTDLGPKHFDIMMPGGGLGIFNGCSGSPPNGRAQFSAPEAAWGARYGGVSARSACAALPSAMRKGCIWRFDSFLNADNPTARHRRVQCPAELIAKSGCQLSDDKNFPKPGADLPSVQPNKPDTKPDPEPEQKPPSSSISSFGVSSWNSGSNQWWLCFSVAPTASTVEVNCGKGWSQALRSDWDPNTWISDTTARGQYACPDTLQVRVNGGSVFTARQPARSRALGSSLLKTTLVKLTLSINYDAIPDGSLHRTEFLLQLRFSVAVSLKTEMARVEVVDLEPGSVVASLIFNEPVPGTGTDPRPGRELARALYSMAQDRNSTLYNQQLTSAITGAECASCSDQSVDLLRSTLGGVPLLAVLLPVVFGAALIAVALTLIVLRHRHRRRNDDVELATRCDDTAEDDSRATPKTNYRQTIA